MPTLLCSTVSTGDPSWIRDETIKPQGLFLNIYDGFMSPEAQADARLERCPTSSLPRQRRRPFLLLVAGSSRK